MTKPKPAVATRPFHSPHAGMAWSVVWYPDESRAEGPFDLPQLRCASEEKANELHEALVKVLESGVDPYNVREVLKGLGIRLMTQGFWTVVQEALGPPTPPTSKVIDPSVIVAAFAEHEDWGPGSLPGFWIDILIEGSQTPDHDFPWWVQRAKGSAKLVFVPKQ